MPPSPQTTRLQSTLRLLIPRLRLLQKKDTASSVAQRRELAQLLDSPGREASARIRVENVIANDIAVEVMEMVELYCELLLARAAVMDQIAFGEKGIKARGRAKEENMHHITGAIGASGDRKSGGGGGGGGGLFSSAFSKVSGAATSTTSSTRHKEDRAEDEIREAGGEEEYIDAGLDEAAAAIFYSWPRFPREVRELTTLRNLLMDRWGKDFAALAQENKATIKVPERLVKRLRVKPPSAELVESYLREIAKAYGVAWPREEVPQKDSADKILDFIDKEPSPDGDNNQDGAGGGDINAATNPQSSSILPPDQELQPPSTPQRPNLAELRRESEAEELSRATPPRDIGPHDATGRSPVSVAPPAPRSDNPNPRVRIPGEQDNTTNKNAPTTSSSKSPTTTTTTSTSNTGAVRKESIGNKIPDVDELSKRFAALKR